LKFAALNIIIFAIVTQIFLSGTLLAQDIHFSQFFTTTVLNNPAHAGVSDNEILVSTNYRNQWASIAQPFHTQYFSIDKKHFIGSQQFGFGLSVLGDQSSGGNLMANKFYFSISYTKFINNHQFVLGIQPGFVYKSFGLSAMTFGSQFNSNTNKFDASLPSYEIGLNDNTRYFDLNIGVLWRTYIRNMMPQIGFSFGHLNRPNESFANSGEHITLPYKYLVHAQIKIPVLPKYDLTPTMLVTYTPGAREFVSGAIGGYNIDKFFIPVKRIYMFNMYRINPVRNIDAIIVGGGLNFAGFNLGISYDLNVSSLYKATNLRGAFEISLQYSGALIQKPVTQPCSIF
jgi:type IX secretion system PorP/SprF family membrane protein